MDPDVREALEQFAEHLGQANDAVELELKRTAELDRISEPTYREKLRQVEEAIETCNRTLLQLFMDLDNLDFSEWPF